MNKRFGTEINANGAIRFNFWAPDVSNVKLCIKEANESYLELPMQTTENGWFSLETKEAKVDSEYMFKLPDELMVPDPASRCQAKDAHGPSVVINPDNFNWGNTTNWKGLPWEETVLYELHTGTFSKEGSYKAIKEKLDHFVDLGITAIELMPLSDFPGTHNWGYDGVLHYAPDRVYGSPDELKDLIKTAHEKGLMVFLDVVYNHFGPDGNYLYCYAKSKFFEHKHITPWGDAINFENRYVRDFFIQNVLYWLEEYRFDGLRFDAVQEIKDDSPVNILREIADTVSERIKNRHVHLVLENDDNIGSLLKEKETKNDYYTAQWNDDFHHCAHILLTGERGGYYGDYCEEKSGKSPTYFMARCLAEGYAYQGENSAYRSGEPRGENSKNLKVSSFVNFIQNHDQVGNRAFGERLSVLTSKEALKSAICLYLMAPTIPMLYMGEEWGSKQPFMFFCNLSEELSASIRDGRRMEFSRFPEYVDPANREKIPDPTTEKTFKDSMLDWDNFDEEILSFYKHMLKSRKEHIIPLISEIQHSESKFEIIAEGCFKVVWQTKKGKKLELLANLSKNNIKYDFNKENVIEKASTSDQNGVLPPWSVYWSLNS